MDQTTSSLMSQAGCQNPQRPFLVSVVSILLGLAGVAALAGGIWLITRGEQVATENLEILLAAVIVAGMGIILARGIWTLKNWASSAVTFLFGTVIVYFMMTVLFDVSSEIFAGESVMPLGDIFSVVIRGVVRIVAYCIVPGAIIFVLMRFNPYFEENPRQRAFVDRSVRHILLATGLSAIFIVFLIIVFTMSEAWESIEKIGLDTMLLGTIWRPGSIIGAEGAQFGMLPMIVGTILSTFGAAVLGVPLSVGAAVLLAEIAPPFVRDILRPAVELLAGIPSVVYGLFGMVVLAPMIAKVQLPYNTGYGLLNASIILAVMIIPTITNIAEDAIRAVPREYKEGSLALGATHWQTIRSVMLPAARSGIVAAIILGIGRALGETMAVIMIIGNSIAMPIPLNDNPLTIFLSTARTLTGNIAVEINYAAGVHRSAIFFTGILLFVMIFLVNSLARYLMRERLPS